MKKGTYIFAIGLWLAGFYLALHFTHRIFDNDLGWHLRFGQDLLHGVFSLTDTYSWGYAGKLWINHEWGGDVLWWVLYTTFGYMSLPFTAALCIWSTFSLVPWAVKQPITLNSLTISLLSLASVHYILAPRLTIIAPLFFLALWHTLERSGTRHYYWTWPLLFWLWSAMHGSWILGFIVIGIYIVGNVFQTILHRQWPTHVSSSTWTGRTYVHIGISASMAFLITAINPYTTLVWHEITSYFTENYYKHYITEWLPSYYFPVEWGSLLITAITIALTIIGIIKKRLNIAQALLIAAFSYSGLMYRRNMLYIALIAIPLLSTTISEAHTILQKSFLRYRPIARLFGVAIPLICIVGVFYQRPVRWIADVWTDLPLLYSNSQPVAAVQVLYAPSSTPPRFIFNEFSWGGYLIAQLPNDKVFFDGRGTATWYYSPTTTFFEHYRTIRYKPGGLNYLETTPVTHILLSPTLTNYPEPDTINRLLFGTEELARVASTTPTPLEIDLAQSPRWKKIYEDRLSLLFERISTTTSR